jgi:hypothetical protein
MRGADEALNVTSGVAPLAVFFDGTAEAGIASERPFHDLSYRWDFGDASSGTFETTGRGRNEALGPLAAHVFEQAGVYTVKLTTANVQGEDAEQAFVITVEDPDEVYSGTNTVCFANGTGGEAFEGCPAGAMQVTAAELSALQGHVASGRRLLLRRGDTFSADEALVVNVAGPGTIGAYGAGEAPVVMSSLEYAFLLEGQSRFSDWRMMDLHVVQSGEGAQNIGLSGAASETATNLLLLRLRVTGGRSGLNSGIQAVATGNDITDGLFVQDTQFEDVNGYALYTAARRFAFLGNSVTDDLHAARGSMMRLHWLERAVIAESVLGPGNVDGDVLYIPGPPFVGEPTIGNGQYANRLLIARNVFRTAMGGLAKVGPQNVSSDERFRDVVVERNLFVQQASGTGMTFEGDVQGVSVRNNLFIVRPGEARCITLRAGGIYDAVPVGVLMSHNTCVCDGDTRIADLEEPAIALEAYNNLSVGTETAQLVWGDPNMVTGTGNLGGTAAWAQLASATPVDWEDFRPAPGSPAVNAADPAHADTWDYSGNPRDDAPDVGALEYVSGQ